MSKTSNKQKKREDNFLLYVPNKKHDQWEVKRNKVLLIFKHDRMVERFARWLVKKPTTSDVELDELGSKVWMLINGERSVYEIGQELKREFGENCEPIYERLIMYLRYLNRKAWISFAKGNQNMTNNADNM